VEVFLSLHEGFQAQEETLKVYETIFPNDPPVSDETYQKNLSNSFSTQTNNPLYL
jgi:hypothetical protein